MFDRFSFIINDVDEENIRDESGTTKETSIQTCRTYFLSAAERASIKRMV